MRMLLTGASGLLGSAFARSATRRGHQVHGTYCSGTIPAGSLAKSHRIDLRDQAKLEALVLELFPDAIVNCAALADPARCQADPERSRQLNLELPQRLAQLARHLFAKLLHISTEQVFDGRAMEPYKVTDKPRPPNTYAKHKRESELRVLEAAAEFTTVLRVPLLNGNSPSARRSLHERLFAAWAAGERTALFTDEVRQPCSAENAADAMVELCERRDLKGSVFHWAGETALSRFEIGSQLVKHFALPPELIQAAERGDDPRFAKRQASLAIDIQPLSGKLKTKAQAFEAQLESLNVPEPCRAWYNAI